jgi:hypothetical protein
MVTMLSVQILVELMRKWVFRDQIVPLALKGIFAVSTDQETHSFSSDFRNNSTGYCRDIRKQIYPHTRIYRQLGSWSHRLEPENTAEA